MFDKNFKCVNPYNFEVGNKLAEAMFHSPGHKILTGPADKRVRNVACDADNPVDFDALSLAQLCRLPGLVLH